MRLVFLHALPLDGRQWEEQARVWPNAVMPTLYSLGSTMEEWAAGVLDLAGSGPLVVVGNSVGGSCALEMARQAPERIEGLVLVGTKAGHLTEPEFRDRFIERLEGERGATVRQWVDGALGMGAEARIRERAHAVADAQALGDLVKGVRVFHGRRDAGEMVAGWEKVLCFVSGDQDRMVTEIPRPVGAKQKLWAVPDCGHYVNLERPGAFNGILSQVLEMCWGRSGA